MLIGPWVPPQPATAAGAAEAPVWRITEVRVPVLGAPGQVAGATAHCPAGQAVIGGDLRSQSDERFIFVNAAFPDPGTQSFLGAAGIDANNGAQSFSVVAYCVPADLVTGLSVVQTSYLPPGGASGTGTAGGGAQCGDYRRVIGGGARLSDISTNATGHLRANTPQPLGKGWYANAKLDGTSVLVNALCLPAESAPPIATESQTVDSSHHSPAYYSGAAYCPNTMRVLSGGISTAMRNQFPSSTDPHQGRVGSSESLTGAWAGKFLLPPGYEATIVVLCVADVDPPKVTMTSPTTTSLAARTALNPSIDVGWSGSDAAHRVVRYQTRWRSAPYNGTFGAWQYPPSWQNLTSNTVTHGSLATGRTYCYSTRGQDPAGNWSAWAGQRCAVRPLDDRRLAVSPGWVRGSGGDHWSDTFTSTTQRDAVLTRTGARFNQLAVIAQKCPTCGRVAVRIDGALVGTVNLSSATTEYRQIVALPRTAGKVGTVTLTVLTSGKVVAIDGLVVFAG